jgi:Xaa-Pro dipeptidase
MSFFDERLKDVERKHSRVSQWIREHNIGAVALKATNNFAWITAGGNNAVGIASDVGASFAVITPDARYIVASTSEAARVAAEEVDGLGFTLKILPWYSNSMADEIATLANGRGIQSDVPLQGADSLPGEFNQLRYSLTSYETGIYRELAALSTRLLEEACMSIRKGQTEYEIAGIVAKTLLSEGIVPVVLLVAADERLYEYRHPIPTGKAAERVFSVSIMAKKYGLQVAITRGVSFGDVPGELSDRQRKVAYVDSVLMTNTRPGMSGGDIFDIAVKAYAEVGYPEEWKRHHQGGPTGYASREWVAFPGCPFKVADNQPIAWNPTIIGAKSEDTILVTQDGVESLTLPGSDWPTIEFSMGGITIKKAGFNVKA